MNQQMNNGKSKCMSQTSLINLMSHSKALWSCMVVTEEQLCEIKTVIAIVVQTESPRSFSATANTFSSLHVGHRAYDEQRPVWIGRSENCRE